MWVDSRKYNAQLQPRITLIPPFVHYRRTHVKNRMFQLIGPESLLVSVALLAAFVYPQLGAAGFNKAQHLLGAFAQRRTTSVISCGVLALALRAALLPVLPIPAPFA